MFIQDLGTFLLLCFCFYSICLKKFRILPLFLSLSVSFSFCNLSLVISLCSCRSLASFCLVTCNNLARMSVSLCNIVSDWSDILCADATHALDSFFSKLILSFNLPTNPCKILLYSKFFWTIQFKCYINIHFIILLVLYIHWVVCCYDPGYDSALQD